MKKFGVFVCVLLAVLVLSMVVAPLVSADWWPPSTWFKDKTPVSSAERPSAGPASGPIKCNSPDVVKTKEIPEWVTSLQDIPLIGSLVKVFFGGGTLDFYIIKLLFFILVFSLIYASLSYVNFPSSIMFRILLSLIIPFFSLFAINANELGSFLISYQGVGTTIIIFFPMAVLSFLTFAVASAGGNPFGVLLQRLAWLIYGAYLLIKGFTNVINNIDVISLKSLAYPKLASIIGALQFLIPRVGCIDGFYAAIYIIVGIGILYIFVWKNEALTLWLAHQAMKADLQATRNKLERGMGVAEALAEQSKSKKG